MRVNSTMNNAYYYINTSNQLNYKGTAFGDPPKFNDNNLIEETSSKNSYPVDFKGTAFGDPAKFNGDISVKANNSAKSYPLEYKGTAFGDPARFADNKQNNIREMERTAMPYKGSNIDKYV